LFELRKIEARAHHLLKKLDNSKAKNKPVDASLF
jgi:hypothetical protein